MTPIHFNASGDGFEESGRVDTPMMLEEALVSVQVQVETTHVVVGIGSGSYAGFFNHGLTLHETREVSAPLLGLAFKVRDSHLEHTLSRDDVRRDAHYQNVLARVKRAAQRMLAPAVQRALKESAASGDAGYGRLAETAKESCGVLGLSPDDLPLRVLEPWNGELWCMPRDCARAVHTDRPSRLTAALAANGITVFHEPGALFDDQRVFANPEDASAYTAVVPQEPSPSEAAMFDAMLAFFERAARRPPGIALVAIHGRRQGPYLGGPVTSWVTRDAIDASPFRLLRRPALLLSVHDSVVAAARAQCVEDPQLAAAILARAVLAHVDLLDAKADLEWTLAALESVEG